MHQVVKCFLCLDAIFEQPRTSSKCSINLLKPHNIDWCPKHINHVHQGI